MSKRLYANGDTLSGELTYTSELRSSIERLQIKGDEMFMVVRRGRVIEKTNGSVEEWRGATQRIVWSTSERRRMHRIREEALPRTVSLAPLYREYIRTLN